MRLARAKRSRDQRGRNRRSDWWMGPKEGLQRRKEESGGGVIRQEMDPKQREKRIEECEEEAAVFLPAMPV